ncbi:ATP-binding cassette domain-containing protein [Candidatus Pelagibacter bacterium]|nr:ATP-binding cassette domain-containing protein [Candidatus Pelagibacter bacterium]
MSNIKSFRIKSYKNKNTILKLENLSFKIGRKIILENLYLKLGKGQILGLLGPNGVGKSTIFNIIVGLLSPSYGSVIIDSHKINNYPIYKRTTEFKIGFVPQNGGFFYDLTVYNNLKAVAEVVIKESNYREEKINSLISKFELESIKDIKADFLSGGQKKKLVIALALLSEPKILLLDEPFAALDVLTIKILQEIIVNLQVLNNISIILCDHQARDLLACVDTAVIINNGKVIAEGTPSSIIQNIEAKKVYFGESFKN